MVKIREEQTSRLEDAASKGLKFGGFKNVNLQHDLLILLILVALTAIFAPYSLRMIRLRSLPPVGAR